MRFAIIGTNFISDNFMDAICQVKDAEVIAVLSRTAERGKEFATRHNITRVYTDIDKMLADRDIDAVYVASPTVCHAEQSIKALKAGKHVLCEKMIAHDYAAFEDMMRAQAKSGRVLLEAMRPDFDPALDIIKKGLKRIGKVRRVSLEFCQYSSRYDAFLSGTVLNAFDPDMKNSALADIGIYPLHLCIMLFGDPDYFTSESIYLHNGFEGAGVLTMHYGDMLATITYSKITDSVNPSVIEGELGSLIIDKVSAPSKITLKLRGQEPIILPYFPVKNNMIYEIRAFMKMAEGKMSAEKYIQATDSSLCIASEALYDNQD